MDTNVIHSLCASASVPLIAIKCCCLRVSLTLKICVHCRRPFFITLSGYPYIDGNSVLAMSFWTGWLSILSYNIDQVLTAIEVPVNALLSHYDPRKIVDLSMVTWRLLGFLADLSQRCRTYTSDFFPMLSVYASCSFSIRYSTLCFGFFFKSNALTC